MDGQTYTIFQSVEYKGTEGIVIFILSGNSVKDEGAYFWYITSDCLNDKKISEYNLLKEGLRFRDLLPNEMEISKIIQLWIQNNCNMHLKDFLNTSLELDSDIVKELEYY